MVVTAFAASSTTFKVNNVSVTGRLHYLDSVDTDPFDRDSVTGRTIASSAMDSVTVQATIYFAEGSTMKSCTEKNAAFNDTECSVTAKESLVGVGYRGKGEHSAVHANKSGSGETSVSW